jgi:hypothetical protein
MFIYPVVKAIQTIQGVHVVANKLLKLVRHEPSQGLLVHALMSLLTIYF